LKKTVLYYNKLMSGGSLPPVGIGELPFCCGESSRTLLPLASMLPLGDNNTPPPNLKLLLSTGDTPSL
jgi:hypothetical protein